MTNLLKFFFRAMLGGALSLAIPGPLQAAEDTIRGTTASTMPHPELLPHGIHRGGYTYYPSFNYLMGYNDNILATENNKESSRISEYTPAIAAVSDWNRHSLNFNASASIGKNHRFSSENYTDWILEANGRVDIRHDMELFAGASVGHEHVDRTAPDETRVIEPTEYDQSRLYARYRQNFGRFAAGVNMSRTRNVYDDGKAIRFGVPVTVDNSDRDRTQTRIRLRGSYNYVGSQSVFVSIESFDRDYDENNPFGGIDRSSSGLEILIGQAFDYHGILLGEISIGYRRQDYEGFLPDIESPIAKASVLWNITDLTTLNIGLDHDIVDAIQLFYSGYQSTTLSLGLDHELRRDLTLNLTLAHTRDDFESVDPFDRKDSTYYLAAGSTYKMNRNLYFSLNLIHENRDSDFEIDSTSIGKFNFTRNLIYFGLLAQF